MIKKPGWNSSPGVDAVTKDGDWIDQSSFDFAAQHMEKGKRKSRRTLCQKVRSSGRSPPGWVNGSVPRGTGHPTAPNPIVWVLQTTGPTPTSSFLCLSPSGFSPRSPYAIARRREPTLKQRRRPIPERLRD